MVVRLTFWLTLVCAGCQSLVPVRPTEGGADSAQGAGAYSCGEEGQTARHAEQPDETIASCEHSLAEDPKRAGGHLRLAADHLEKGDEAGACPHLARYLEANPAHRILRVQYAELLWRLKRGRESRAAFERAVADAQDELPVGHLIHCHTRLMQLAEDEQDEYDQHLNRGIGLYLLARERDALPDPECQQSVEGLLCQAAGELTRARLERPDEARPCWYLYRVWGRLAQRQPALRALREADASAPFSYLTPAEQRGLQLAGREEHRWR